MTGATQEKVKVGPGWASPTLEASRIEYVCRMDTLLSGHVFYLNTPPCRIYISLEHALYRNMYCGNMCVLNML